MCIYTHEHACVCVDGYFLENKRIEVTVCGKPAVNIHSNRGNCNYLEWHEIAEAPIILPTTEAVVDVPTEAGTGGVLVYHCDRGLGTHIPTTVHVRAIKCYIHNIISACHKHLHEYM